MAVPAGPTEQRYVGNGVTTIFTVPFLVIQASDLAVYLNGVRLSSGYSQAGVGNPSSTVTFTTAPVVGADILLALDVPFERLNDYQENGDFLARTVNNDFDRIWQALKQLYRYSGRALTLGTTDVDGAGMYRAKGNGIANLASADSIPTSAANFADIVNYVNSVFLPGTGPINDAANVMFLQSGIGTIARNIQERMRERVSVKDFTGVIGDGIHDDTVGLQAAINDGRPLDFGGTENRYRITADLIPKNGGRYYGYGATIYQEAIGEEAFACTALTDAKFHGLTLIGASPDPLITDGTNRAFELFAPKDVVIELCTMKNWGSAGVFLTGGGAAAYGPLGCKVINNEIENCNDGIFTYVGGVGNIIAGNTIRRSGRTGIFIDDVSFSSGGTPGIATMLTVTGNIIENYGSFAEAAGITSGAMRRCNISGNLIGPGNGAGVSLFAGGAEADPPTATNGVLVMGNIIYRPSKQSVVLVGVQYSQIVHNICWEANFGASGNNSAIDLQAMTRAATTVGSDKNIINSNIIVRGSGDVDYGIRLRTGCSSNRVRDNVIEGATVQGVLDEGTSNSIKDNDGYKTEASGVASITTGNTFVDVTHGLNYTPLPQDITVTPNSSLGAATYHLISGAPNATTFRIALNANPGATVTLAWSIRKN